MSNNTISKQTFIVTGASTGLGFEAIQSLAENPSSVIIMIGDNQISLNYAIKKLNTHARAKIIPRYVNLADLNSVRKFAHNIINSDIPPLRCIICNASIIQESNIKRSVDGFELTFAVNYLGHFLLTILLLNNLISPARIIIVSSSLHYGKKKLLGRYWKPRFIKAEWLAYPEKNPLRYEIELRSGIESYADSKLCNILFTYELSRRLESIVHSDFDKNISVNIFNPGLMSTAEIAYKSQDCTMLNWQKKLFQLFNFESSISTLEESGKNLAWLATSPEVANITNSYFVGRTLNPSSIESRNIRKSAELWNMSMKMANIDESEFDWLSNCKIASA